MGKEEGYFYNIPSFLEEPLGGPLTKLPIWNPFRLVMIIFYNVYLFVVPFAYIKIFMFRKNNMNTKISEEHRLFWKRRNIVSTWYNMAVWLAEGVFTILVSVDLFCL